MECQAPHQYAVSALAHALMRIKKSLLETWHELGWLYSNTRSIDGYPDNPGATEIATERLAHLSAGMTVVFIFAVREEHIEPKGGVVASIELNRRLSLLWWNQRAMAWCPNIRPRPIAPDGGRFEAGRNGPIPAESHPSMPCS